MTVELSAVSAVMHNVLHIGRILYYDCERCKADGGDLPVDLVVLD